MKPALLLFLIFFQATAWIAVSRALETSPPPSRPVAQSGSTPSRKLTRAPASVYAPKNVTQGEQMLNDVREPKPGFLRQAEPRSVFFAACRTTNGSVSYSFSDPHGYEDCLDERYSPAQARGAGAAYLLR